MTTPDPAKGTIAEGLRRGDEAALRALLDKMRPVLLARAIAVLHDRSRSEDVIQETALKLWNRRDRLPADDLSLQGYFARAVTNAAINALRGQVRRRRTERLGARPERVPPPRDDAVLAWEYVTKLPSDVREVIELRYLEGLTIGETAERLGLPEGTVSTRQRTGLESLRTQMVTAGLGVASTAALAGLLTSVSVPTSLGTVAKSASVSSIKGATIWPSLKPAIVLTLVAAGFAAAVGFVLNLSDPAKVNQAAHTNEPPANEAVAIVLPEPEPEPPSVVAPAAREMPILRVGYVETLKWGRVSQLDVRGFDFVTHAFMGINEDGTLSPLDRFDEYRKAGLVDVVTQQGARPLFSIGGVNSGPTFSKVAADSESRKRLVDAVLGFLKDGAYEGVEINWQFPRTEERDAFTTLMTELHSAIKGKNANHLVGFAAGSGYWLGSFDWKALAKCTDYAVVTAYAWNNPAGGPISNPQSSLKLASGSTIEASVKGALDYVLDAGYPAPQLIAVLPTFSSADTPWHKERDIWLIGRPWKPHDDYLETNMLDEWWTTPVCIEMKMSALLDPKSSVLAEDRVIGGVALWELGEEAPAARDLSRAMIDWTPTLD